MSVDLVLSPLPTKEIARDRVLSDEDLARVIIAVRKIGGPYGSIVELLALTGQCREEVAQATWEEWSMTARGRLRTRHD